MSSTAELIWSEFGKACNLYEVFGIEKSATEKEHPDKHRGDDESKAKSTARFQAISAIHSILSNAEARALYDETGSIGSPDDMEDSPSFQMWVDYFARIFPKVTEADITKFEQQYRFSDEERRDVVEAYRTLKGSMQDILDSIMLCTDDDEDRFAEMIENELTVDKSLKVFARWKEYRSVKASKPKKKETEAQKKKRQAKKDKEALEAEELMNMIRGNQQKRASGSGVTALTAKRERDFSSLIASIESKYTDTPKTKKGKKKHTEHHAADAFDEPSEEAFLATQQRLMQGRSKRK